MKHEFIEQNGLLMGVLAFIMIAIGGAVEIIPMFTVKAQVPTIASVKPYTPLELEGRDIYIREGCYLCHSQMVRPFRDETERYGPYSKAGEFIYDHPFQWGSKRIGPDLHRVGGKYPNAWHYAHMRNPRDVSPGSIMPNYPWLYTTALDTSLTQRKMRTLREVGVPYTDAEIAAAPQALQAQAQQITSTLTQAAITDASADREIIALIAYLQRLGTDIGWRQTASR